jgi:hypothetical protein
MSRPSPFASSRFSQTHAGYVVDVTFTPRREESFDIPATLVDEELMFTACVRNIQYTTRPNSLLFLSLFPFFFLNLPARHLKLSAQYEHKRLTSSVRLFIGTPHETLQKPHQIYFIWLAVPIHTDVCITTRGIGSDTPS